MADAEAARAAIGGSYPTVLKFDGLAAGKGVAVCPDEASAEAFLDAAQGAVPGGVTSASLVDLNANIQIRQGTTAPGAVPTGLSAGEAPPPLQAAKRGCAGGLEELFLSLSN